MFLFLSQEVYYFVKKMYTHIHSLLISIATFFLVEKMRLYAYQTQLPPFFNEENFPVMYNLRY